MKKSTKRRETSRHLGRSARRRLEQEILESWTPQDAVDYLNERSTDASVRRTVATKWLVKRLGDSTRKATETLRALGASKGTSKFCIAHWRSWRKEQAHKLIEQSARDNAAAIAKEVAKRADLPLGREPRICIKNTSAAKLMSLAVDTSLNILDLVAKKQGVTPSADTKKPAPFDVMHKALSFYADNARAFATQNPDGSYKQAVRAIDPAGHLYAIYDMLSVRDKPVFPGIDTLLEIVPMVLYGAARYCENELAFPHISVFVRVHLDHTPMIALCAAVAEKSVLD